MWAVKWVESPSLPAPTLLPLAWSETSVLNRRFSIDGQRPAKLHLFKDALRVNTELLSVCLGPTWMKKVFFFKGFYLLVSK